MSEGTKLYRGGVPTRPDVDNLLKLFDVRQEGDIVPYSAITDTIHQAKHSSRWIAVMGALKKALRVQRNIELETVNGKGYRIAPPSTRIALATDEFRAGQKRIIRAGDKAARTDATRLTEGEGKTRDALILISGKVAGIAAAEARAITWKPTKREPYT